MFNRRPRAPIGTHFSTGAHVRPIGVAGRAPIEVSPPVVAGGTRRPHPAGAAANRAIGRRGDDERVPRRSSLRHQDAA